MTRKVYKAYFSMKSMANKVIYVPRFIEGREFYDNDLAEALTSVAKEGYEAQFMPSVIDARIQAPKDARIWQAWYDSVSARITGRTKQQNPVVVYAHIPNYLSNPENIKTAKEQGLVNGAANVPQEEFQRLLDLEDRKNVFVVDYNTLKNSKNGVISLKNALKHPQTIPFIGGEERAIKYLERHREVYGENIGNWHSDDLYENSLGGRLLYVGDNDYGSLNGSRYLNRLGRFVGVSNKDAEGVAPKNLPDMAQLEKVIGEYVAPVNKKELLERFGRLLV